KTLIAPLVGAVILFAIVLQFVVLQGDIRHAVDDMNGAAATAGEASSALSEFHRSSAALFRSLSWRAMKIEAERIKGAEEEGAAALKRAADILNSDSRKGAAIDPALLATTLEILDAYRKAATQTLEMVDADPFSATMFLSEAHRKSEEAKAAIQKVLAAAGA